MAPPDDDDLVLGRGQRPQRVIDVGEPVGDRLHPGADEVLGSCGQGEPGDDPGGVVVPAGRAFSGEKWQEGQTGGVRSKRGRRRGRLVIAIGAGGVPDPAQQIAAVGERAAEDGALDGRAGRPTARAERPRLIRRSRQDHAHGGGGADGERDAATGRWRRCRRWRKRRRRARETTGRPPAPASARRTPRAGSRADRDRRAARGDRRRCPTRRASRRPRPSRARRAARFPRPCRWWRRPRHRGRAGPGRTRQTRASASCGETCPGRFAAASAAWPASRTNGGGSRSAARWRSGRAARRSWSPPAAERVSAQ